MAANTRQPIDIDSAASQCQKVLGYIEKYRADAKEIDRERAVEAAAVLVRLLEQPADAIYKLFLSPTILMAVKTASDLGIFSRLCDGDAFVTCKELATPKGADVQLIERIMRALVCSGFAAERGPGQYMPTRRSKAMTARTVIGLMDSLFVDFLPIIHKTPEFLRETDYRNPEDPTHGPLQYTHKTTSTTWDWLSKRPAALDRFNSFMEGNRAGRSHWAEWFPVQERLLDGAVVNKSPLLVDIAGGRGHDLIKFKQRFPGPHGDLVLEELPAVIDDISNLDEDLRRVKHDFFQPQPIKGARVYYMKHVMHDWSDGNCRIILGHVVDAMERGYSKLLIEEHILPDQHAKELETLRDLIVMVWCPGNERTRQRWTELLESVGLEIQNFWLPDGFGTGIVEAVLKDDRRA
ncbi:S-adenosyl-L-methionine-dependent methyltransferase [Aspergillus avenaceus]|uniref:S-adenosyl-L-methionine-dependent methyltransferase n=1 Tax=Aspergillus avenaceus TaxID=36643 RepID=A0A5N6TVV2_ASPAV|nr:S-adenosyl-L-methionine-dependent methyltransferase [Aspergillus avenaceus]